MKTLKNIFAFGSLALLLLAFTNKAAATTCTITKTNGGGFTTTIQSVVNNCNGTYTIQLLLVHNGCGGPSCQTLSHLSIQAAPGTYSNMSRQVITGSMTGGNLVVGPNLGSDPFQGFKFDNTGNIGGGVAGSVLITYTLTSLQQQSVSAKAGNNGQIATFTVADFTYVMNCNSTNCPQSNNDSDNDGCPDNEDTYPNDPARCLDNYKTGSLAFEDLWPSKGDYDFNDMVVDYELKTTTNSNNKVIDIVATFTVKAFGAGFENGFGFQFPNNISQAHFTASGSRLNENYITLGSNGLENSQNRPTFIVFDNAYKIMTHPGSGIGVNTTANAPYVAPATITISISVQPNTYTMNEIGIHQFNPFIIVNKVRGHEVHLPNYPPTALMNTSLFGTGSDASVPAQNKYFVTSNNLPWGIHIPESFDYPKEKVDIVNTHLKFVQWAESNGTQSTDWYKDLSGYRNTNNVY